MKNQILSHLNDPRQLERLYRVNKVPFKKEFSTLYPQLKGNPVADFWNERLNYEGDEISWGSGTELAVVIGASLLAGLIAKLPALFSIDEAFFYSRNISFVILPALMGYFAWKNRLSAGKLAFIVGASLVGLLFINSLPVAQKSDTLTLSCLHLPLFLWSVLGVAFTGEQLHDAGKRLDFLKYNGDLLVMTALILIAGGILTGITIGLFTLIGFTIEEFYFNYIAIFGLAAAPLVGTYLTQTNPHLVGKVAPLIAKLFSPLVVIMLICYLVAIAYSGKNPYNDRDFLLTFNALLIGVMAIIFFSVAETDTTAKTRTETGVLFLLSVITIVVNGIALSAILFRISEWGLTPNRVAVLGGNGLILINLMLVTAQLYRALINKGDRRGVGKAIGAYLPVYFGWTFIVTFLFPFLFGFQ